MPGVGTGVPGASHAKHLFCFMSGGLLSGWFHPSALPNGGGPPGGLLLAGDGIDPVGSADELEPEPEKSQEQADRGEGPGRRLVRGGEGEVEDKEGGDEDSENMNKEEKL
ncbi:MAG: hypothetical protein M1823_006024 [Watsoniomyces obsoletus]|nr:MAG: hypothetical protein M1823_006024 [Watsoniomyces obsoletus]